MNNIDSPFVTEVPPCPRWAYNDTAMRTEWNRLCNYLISEKRLHHSDLHLFREYFRMHVLDVAMGERLTKTQGNYGTITSKLINKEEYIVYDSSLETAVRRYAGCLKLQMEFAEKFGILPSGRKRLAMEQGGDSIVESPILKLFSQSAAS